MMQTGGGLKRLYLGPGWGDRGADGRGGRGLPPKMAKPVAGLTEAHGTMGQLRLQGREDVSGWGTSQGSRLLPLTPKQPTQVSKIQTIRLDFTNTLSYYGSPFFN